MVVALSDYSHKKTRFEIGNLDYIYLATMCVISGDEVLKVIYKNGTEKTFDSCTRHRWERTLDCMYTMYMPGYENLFEEEEWINRDDYYYM